MPLKKHSQWSDNNPPLMGCLCFEFLYLIINNIYKQARGSVFKNIFAADKNKILVFSYRCGFHTRFIANAPELLLFTTYALVKVMQKRFVVSHQTYLAACAPF